MYTCKAYCLFAIRALSWPTHSQKMEFDWFVNVVRTPMMAWELSVLSLFCVLCILKLQNKLEYLKCNLQINYYSDNEWITKLPFSEWQLPVQNQSLNNMRCKEKLVSQKGQTECRIDRITTKMTEWTSQALWVVVCLLRQVPGSIIVWATSSVSSLTANEGLVRIQYECLVPISVFPELKLRGLVISKIE